MKRLLVAVPIFVLFVGCSQSYMSVGAGKGGPFDANNYSIEYGAAPGHLTAVGFTLIASGDMPSGVIETRIPHDDFTDLGTRRDDEIGFYGKYGFELGGRVFLSGILGISFFDEAEIARSNVTGWLWEQSSSEKFNGMIGAGLSYVPIKNSAYFNVDIDNRRGVNGAVGFVW